MLPDLLADPNYQRHKISNCMTKLEQARLELTESQLLSIKERIKAWKTKDQVIDMMRYRYGRLDDQAA